MGIVVYEQVRIREGMSLPTTFSIRYGKDDEIGVNIPACFCSLNNR